MAILDRDGTTLAYEERGAGDPTVVLIHGIACNRAFLAPQVRDLAARHRVISVDLRGHGESSAPRQRYTIAALADDVAWLCDRRGATSVVVVGHSLGGLVGLELAATCPRLVRAAVLIDSVLLLGDDRRHAIDGLVAGIRGAEGDRVLRDYFRRFFGPQDPPAVCDWILDQAAETPGHVTSSIWEESLRSWDDARALAACRVPLLYLDAGTPNADLSRARELNPSLTVAQTTGSGHFSPLVCPGQVNDHLTRFLAVADVR